MLANHPWSYLSLPFMLHLIWGQQRPLIAHVVQSCHHFKKESEDAVFIFKPDKIHLKQGRLTLTRIGHLHTTGVLQQSS